MSWEYRNMMDVGSSHGAYFYKRVEREIMSFFIQNKVLLQIHQLLRHKETYASTQPLLREA